MKKSWDWHTSSPPREHRVYPLQCSKDPRNPAKTNCFYGIYYDKLACTPCMSSYTAIYWDIQLYTHKYLYIFVWTAIYLHILICTRTYSYIPRYTFIYSYILWSTDIYRHILLQHRHILLHIDIYYFNKVNTRIYWYVFCISVYILLNTSPRDFHWDFHWDFSLGLSLGLVLFLKYNAIVYLEIYSFLKAMLQYISRYTLTRFFYNFREVLSR